MTDSRALDWSDADVMCTDPPYDANVYKRATSQSRGRGTRHRDLGHLPIDRPLLEWTCSLAASVKRWSCIFTDVESVGTWRDGLQNAGATYIRALPWIRWSMPQLSGDRPPQAMELIVIAWGAARGRKSWNGPGNFTHFDAKALRGDGKHKCEKPLDLMLQLVEYFSNADELVIDPFCGSGATLLAAHILGRRVRGNDNDAAWNAKAHQRLVSPLTARDEERMARYFAGITKRAKDKHRVKMHTAKARAAMGTSYRAGQETLFSGAR